MVLKSKPDPRGRHLRDPAMVEKARQATKAYHAAKKAAKSLSQNSCPPPLEGPPQDPTKPVLDPVTGAVIKPPEIPYSHQDFAKKLPHLYGQKWYAWARAFFNSTNKMNLLCAGNQLSKSSTQIRKCIHWATAKKLWPKLWPMKEQPRIFWYMYPSKEVATVEVETKWIPEFLPREEMATSDKQFGYEVVYDKKHVNYIRFNTGVTVYFKTYSQGGDNLQTATVDAVFTDEEMPEDKYSEVAARLIASDGYYHMVFTATLNQDMWRRALEGKGDQELFPDALKLQVSMYDCMRYDDGTPSIWTEERIAREIARCKSKLEVERRIMGRFVTEVGRKYGGFDAARHFIKTQPIPESWRWYCGVDVGSGQGTKTHKAAITMVAVRPDMKLGYVARGWRGDGEVTTAGDVFEKFKELRGHLRMSNQRYDPSAKDFAIIAARNSEGFEKADRQHDTGEGVVNTLFQNDMLYIFDTPELRKLGAELSSILKTTAKQNAKDDFADSLRYCVATIPFDFTAIKGGTPDEVIFDDWGPLEDVPTEKVPKTAEEIEAEMIRQRRGEGDDQPSHKEDGWQDLFNDIDEANESYG